MKILLIVALLMPPDESPDAAVKAVKALVEAGETEVAAQRLLESARKFPGEKKIVDLASGLLGSKDGMAAAAVEALGLVSHKDAIDRLVRELGNAALKEDALKALRKATSQSFAAKAEWEAWWKKNRAAFVFRKDRRSGTDVEAARSKLGDAPDFREFASEHYLVLSDAPEERVQSFLKEFEELHATMMKDHGFDELDRLLVVYCFKDEEGIRGFSQRERGPMGGGMMGGFASRDGWLAFYDSPKLNLTHVVFHEGAHQILFNCLGIVEPNWFHEGMAECVASRRRRNETFVAKAVKEEIGKGSMLPLSTLMEEGIRGRQMAYLQAGSVVRFLREKHGEKAFAAWLKDLAAGKTSVAETVKAFGYANVEELEAGWKQHWK
jgi:hypothetical protein